MGPSLAGWSFRSQLGSLMGLQTVPSHACGSTLQNGLAISRVTGMVETRVFQPALACLGMFTWQWHLYKVVNRAFAGITFSSKEKEETPPYNLPSCAMSPDKLMVHRGCHAYHGFLAPQNHLVQLPFVFFASQETQP